jgi:hypothetical protein
LRNAYLAVAFVVLPYAVLQLVPPGRAPIAWVALGVGYYALHGFARHQSYRRMGHGTITLAAALLVLPGAAGRIATTDRVVALLALGAVLVAVALVMRRRRA